MRTLSLPALQAILAAETDEVFLTCITVAHDDLAAPLRFVDDRAEVVRTAGTFLPFPFTITLPTDAEDELPQVRLAVDNVERELVVAVRTLTSAPTVLVEIVTATDPDTVELACDFTVLEVETDATEMVFTLGYEDVLNQAFPALTFSPSTAAGLF